MKAPIRRVIDLSIRERNEKNLTTFCLLSAPQTIPPTLFITHVIIPCYGAEQNKNRHYHDRRDSKNYFLFLLSSTLVWGMQSERRKIVFVKYSSKIIFPLIFRMIESEFFSRSFPRYWQSLISLIQRFIAAPREALPPTAATITWMAQVYRLRCFKEKRWL